MRSVQDAELVRKPAQEGLSGRHKIKMKSLYFQTVGIECKFYENQQLEYRFLYFNKQKRRHAYDLEITLAVSHLFLCRMGA